MPDFTALLSYTLACIAIIIVPGPTVTVIIANSMRHGTRAGLLNVLGTQIGLASMIAVLAFGLHAIVAGMRSVFEIVRLLGAAYLIWIGIRMWRSDGTLGMADAPPRADSSLVLQGFVVFWSNPKTLLFFGAFIPQFIDPARNLAWQTLLLGSIFMLTAAVSDSLYAIAAGGAGAKLTKARVRLAERISGTCLIGGGLWLALSRR